MQKILINVFQHQEKLHTTIYPYECWELILWEGNIAQLSCILWLNIKFEFINAHTPLVLVINSQPLLGKTLNAHSSITWWYFQLVGAIFSVCAILSSPRPSTTTDIPSKAGYVEPSGEYSMIKSVLWCEHEHWLRTGSLAHLSRWPLDIPQVVPPASPWLNMQQIDLPHKSYLVDCRPFKWEEYRWEYDVIKIGRQGRAGVIFCL